MTANRHILFEKFEILECIKKDAVSSVYLARHIFLAKKILLKTLNKKDLQETIWLDRFKREAKILAQLDHPNVIRVLDFGSDHNNFYISFEYFESTNLRTTLTQGRLSLQEKLQLLEQLLAGLAAAHQKGIVHRDIKPENILVDTRLRLKIADFGLAITAEENLLTAKSSIVGTPAYMSPEQIRGARLTPASDLFSLGIVAFEMFCGYNPFLGAEINITINNILNPPYAELGGVIDRCIPGIAATVKKLLRFEGYTRPASAAELTGSGDVQTDVPEHREVRPGKRVIYYYVPGLALLALSAWLVFGPDQPETTTRITQDTLSVISSPGPMDTAANNRITPGELGSRLPETTDASSPGIRAERSGHLSVHSVPPAMLRVDTLEYGILSDRTVLTMPPGVHELTLQHEAFPGYRREFRITAGETLTISLRLDSLFGYYTCEAYPWGSVYFAGKYQGDTPILNPVRYAPGRYAIVIENPDFPLYQDTITVCRNETTRVRVNLETLLP